MASEEASNNITTSSSSSAVGMFWGCPKLQEVIKKDEHLEQPNIPVAATAGRILAHMGHVTDPNVVMAMYSGIDTSDLYGE